MLLTLQCLMQLLECANSDSGPATVSPPPAGVVLPSPAHSTPAAVPSPLVC
jgi:hypothetical protein